MQNPNWSARQEISDKIHSLRNAGMLDDAIAVCLEAAKHDPSNYFYPKIAGDLYFQKSNYELASRYFLDYLKKLPISDLSFADFAKRYYRLKRVWSSDEIAKYASLLLSEIKNGILKPQLTNRTENLIKSDLPREFIISEEGKKFAELLNEDRDFNRLIQQEKKLEAINPVELEVLLDQHVLNRKRSLKSYRIDSYSVSVYEKLEKHDNALKIAEELLFVRLDSVIIRSIFRICRKIVNYQRVDQLLGSYPEILKSNDFNILYELVYYFETQNNLEQVQSTLHKMERIFADSLPIQKTIQNFYLRFGLIDDANRVGIVIRDKKGRFFGELLETEEEVSSKIKDLYSQVEHKTRLAAISDLTTGISHELGQPITNIRYTVQFYSRMFERRLEKEEVLKVFASILEETERMGALVKRLSPLTSSKSITDKFDIIDRIRKRIQAENARITKEKISVNITPRRPVYLIADPVKFDQIINNLLLNSIDAIREKKIRGPNDIDIRVKENKDGITILFSDSGIGIPAKSRGKVFDPFFTTKPPGKGEGLGLFIAWNILKIFGGKIILDPKVSEGTRFIITLPKIVNLEKEG